MASLSERMNAKKNQVNEIQNRIDAVKNNKDSQLLNRKLQNQDGELVNFEFVYQEISHKDVVSGAVKVWDENPRNQSSLSVFDVQDIAATFINEGQHETAFAFKDKNGDIQVFDGSRRLAANKLLSDHAHVFKVWVTEQPFDLFNFMSYDKGTEAKKSRTAIEQGKYWLSLLDQEGIELIDTPKIKRWCKTHQISYNTLRKYVKLTKLDEFYYNLAIAPTDLSVRNIETLIKIQDSVASLSKVDADKKKEQLRAESEKMKQGEPSKSALAMNASCIKKFTKHLPRKAQMPDDLMTLFEDGRKKVIVKKVTDRDQRITFSRISAAKMEEIYNTIEDILEKPE